jgi:membrane protease YdiL (CAAX protease family)
VVDEARPAVSEIPPRWGLGDAALGLVIGFVAVAIALAIAGVSPDDDLTFGAFVLGQTALWAGLLGVPLWASRRKGTGSLAADFGLDVRWRDARLGIPIGLLSQFILVPLVYLPAYWLVDTDDLDRPAREVADTAQGWEYLLLAVVLVVGAPIIEELFFRGLVLRSLTRRMGRYWALGGSAIVFGLSHFQALQLPALIVVGVVFGLLALRSGRLGPSIWAHGAFNVVLVVILALS